MCWFHYFDKALSTHDDHILNLRNDRHQGNLRAQADADLDKWRNLQNVTYQHLSVILPPGKQ